MPDYVPLISTLLRLRDHQLHGHKMTVSVDDPKQYTGVWPAFEGTVGEFIEIINRLMNRAHLDGQRDAYRTAIDAGAQLSCPICHGTFYKDSFNGMDLAEDALMCENCRYGD